jgi:hypothetical protein
MPKSKNGGVSTTDIEVTSISRQGFWLYLGGGEQFVSFREFPWFEDAPVKEIKYRVVSAGSTELAGSRR